MNIKEQFTTVTPFSKVLALIIFILLLIGGFWLGFEYKIDLELRNDIKNRSEESPILEEDTIIDSSNDNLLKTLRADYYGTGVISISFNNDIDINSAKEIFQKYNLDMKRFDNVTIEMWESSKGINVAIENPTREELDKICSELIKEKEVRYCGELPWLM